MLYNIYHADTVNVGDLRCAVRLYFDFKQHVEPVNLADALKYPWQQVDGILVGGGGVLHPDQYEQMCFLPTLSSNLIGWGIGANTHDTSEITYPTYFAQYRLLGVRDWGQGYDWVPCPSCMSAVFDRPVEIERDVGVYQHASFPISTEFPTRDNTSDFDEAIAFLGSCATVITNSYHGVYWATLLGRKVICLPFSSRFYGFRHPPVLCADLRDWQTHRPEVYPEALHQCRDANARFYQRVLACF